MRIGIDLGLIAPGDGDHVPLLQGVLKALFAKQPECRFELICTQASAGLFPELPANVHLDVLAEGSDDHFSRFERVVAERPMDVLFRSSPFDGPLPFPASRQVVLIPDMQTEAVPGFLEQHPVEKRQDGFTRTMAESGAIATLSERMRGTILAHPAFCCRDVFLIPPAQPEIERADDERATQCSWDHSADNLFAACERAASRTPSLDRRACCFSHSMWERIRPWVEPYLPAGVPRLIHTALHWRPVIHAARHPRVVLGPLLRRCRDRLASPIRRAFAPKLGVLYQYPSRPLTRPSASRRSLPVPTPVISIVTPSFNQAIFLERTMRSVLDQKYPALEYIVQDGNSTDGTLALLTSHRDELSHFESRRDRGQAHAINLGFRHATGGLMAYLNSDDLLMPGALAFVARYFHTHPDVDVIYGHRIVIDLDDQEVGRWILPPHDDDILSWVDFVPQETLFWRKRIWDRVGGIDDTFQFALDWDMLLRFRDAGARIVRVPRFLGAFRVHPEQKTSSRMADLGSPEIDRLRQRSLGRSVTQEEMWDYIQPYMRRHARYQFMHRVGLLF